MALKMILKIVTSRYLQIEIIVDYLPNCLPEILKSYRKIYILFYFLADFCSHFDPKFGPNTSKMIFFYMNHDNIFLKDERYGQPSILITYLIYSQKILETFTKITLSYIFRQILAPIFTRNLVQVHPKWYFFCIFPYFGCIPDFFPKILKTFTKIAFFLFFSGFSPAF